jgi:hypothetical protein
MQKRPKDHYGLVLSITNTCRRTRASSGTDRAALSRGNMDGKFDEHKLKISHHANDHKAKVVRWPLLLSWASP